MNDSRQTAAPWGICFLCGRRILSAYVETPAVTDARGKPLYMAHAHATCADLTQRGLTGDALATARAEVQASLDSLERFYSGAAPQGG